MARYGRRFTQSSSVGTALYDAIGLNFVKSTDTILGIDDFILKAPFAVYRVILKQIDGVVTVVAKEGTKEFDKYVTNKDGDVYTWIPKAWLSRTQEGTDEVWIVSDEPLEGYIEQGGFYVSSYQLGDNGTTCQSMPNLPVKVNTSWAGFNTLQRAKGMYVMDYSRACYLQILGSIKYGNLNWQSVIGSGISNTYSGEGTTTAEKAVISETNVNRIVVANATAAKFSLGSRAILVGSAFLQRLVTAITTYDASNMAITLDGAVFTTVAGTTGIRRAVDGTGGADSVLGTDGMPTGTDGKTSVKTLGIENWYANAWNLLGGAFRYNNVDFYVNTNVENINAWPATIEEAIANGYVKLDGSLPASSSYVQTMNYDRNMPFATIIKTVGGTSVSPVGDYFYTTAGNGFYVVLLGGALNYGSGAGPAYAAVSFGVTIASWNIGAFGLFIPSQEPTQYSDNQLASGYFSNLRISSKARTDEELANTGALSVDEYTTYYAPFNSNLGAQGAVASVSSGEGQTQQSRTGAGYRAMSAKAAVKAYILRTAKFHPQINVSVDGGKVLTSRVGSGYRTAAIMSTAEVKLIEPSVEICPEIRERQSTTEVIGVPYAGDTIKIKGTFKTFEGVAADPTSITLKIYDTINNLLTTINVTSANRVSAGTYEVEYTIPDGYQALYYEWHCTQGGSPQVTMGKITVLKRGQAS